MAQGRELRALYRRAGFKRLDLAKFLQISERTIYAWEAGTTRVPVAVVKLLRLLTRQELPGKTWAGWVFHSDTLWSPEGHGFTGKDFAWLSLTCRRSDMFDVLYRERNELRAKLTEARRQLAQAEEEAITAEGRAGVLELAIWGVQLRERHGSPTTGGPAGGAARHQGETRSWQGDGHVTRSQILTGETKLPNLPHGETLLAPEIRLPDVAPTAWRTTRGGAA